MISRERIRELIHRAFEEVKKSDADFQDLTLDPVSIIIGMDSPLDSIGVSVFLTSLEEQIEGALGKEYILSIENLYALNQGKTNLSVDDLCRLLAIALEKEHG